MLRFAEEILLLLLNEGSGATEEIAVPEPVLHHTLAGAVLMELALEDRIDTDLDHLIVTDPTPLGDSLIDPTLARIVETPEDRNAEYWVRTVAQYADQVRSDAVARMLSRGILTSADDGSISLARSVARTRQYPSGDGSPEQEVRLRIMRVLFGDDIPGPRDVVIICLAEACGLFRKILSRDELKEAQDRIELVLKMDLIGRSLIQSVRQFKPKEEAVEEKGDPNLPVVKGLPILGSALQAGRNMTQFIVESYRRHGPVFEVNLFGINAIVIAGLEANAFFEKRGKFCLRNHEFWMDFNRELNVSKVMMSLEGNDHLRYRQTSAPSYSRTRYEGHLDMAIDITRNSLAEWEPNRPMWAVRALQRIIVDQLGTILTGLSPRGYVESLHVFLDTLLAVRVTKQRPMFLYARKFRRARQRIDELCKQILADHRSGGPRHEAADFVNDILDLHESDPQFMPETDLNIAVLGPFLVGLDTVAVSCAFMLYALLKHPDLMERATAEADALFADGNPSARDLRKMDVTHRVALEVLRMYPIVPVLARISANSFEFSGYRIPAGRRVFVATSVPHFLPEVFPDPKRFDIDRYLPERAEHKQRNAFTPFGGGPHRCMGAGFADAQILLTMATILHHTELSLERPGYELQIGSMPTPRPSKNFKFKMVGRRN